MKSQFKNTTFTNGYLFSHNLKKRTSKKGVDYISGEINIATDDAGTNVIPVFFGYNAGVAVRKSGKENGNYAVLADIIDHGKTFQAYGKDADKVRVSGNIGLNEFYGRDGELVSYKRVEGSFIHMANETEIAENPSTFATDMLIVNVAEQENDKTGDYLTLRGYVFDFFKNILPVTLTIRSESGMNYFLGQDISKTNPMFTEVRGEIISTTIVSEKEIEGAFGEPLVVKTSTDFRAWDVTWASMEPGEFDDESTITKKELKQLLSDREEKLAQNKQYQESREAAKDNGHAFTQVSDPVSTSAPVANEDDEDDMDFEF